MALVAVNANAGDAEAREAGLDGAGTSEPGHQNVGGRAVAIGDGAPDEVRVGGAVALVRNKIRERLMEEAEILAANENGILEPELMVAGRVHGRDGDEKFHHALEREGVGGVDAGAAPGVLGADAGAAVESGGEGLKLAFERGKPQRAGKTGRDEK